MTMPKNFILGLTGVACGAALTVPDAAWAQSCGVSGNAVAPRAITYDPFGRNGLNQIEIPLTLTRVTGPTGDKTQQVNFVLTKPVGAPNYEITYEGVSILYTEGNLMGHPQLRFTGSGEVNYNFGGGNKPDTVTLPSQIKVTVPANVDLSAGRPIEFDIVYVCDGTGSLRNITTPTKLSAAVKINVNVLSALQASYIGSVLNFGEVGKLSTAEVLAAPAQFTSPAGTNNIRVASSGPYQIQLSSDHDFRLMFSGGSLTNDSHTLKYKLGFLNQTLATGSTFQAVVCGKAGLGAVHLPIQARLLEGGQMKTPATGAHTDTITITVSPLLDSATMQQPCSTLSYGSL
jgi:spore coat protein U-like protein